MIREADRKGEIFFQRRHGTQVQLIDRSWVACHAMEQDELGTSAAPERCDRARNLGKRGSAGRQDRSQLAAADPLQKWQIGNLA